MGWLWVWLQDRQERRAEAAARRQMIALGIDSFDVEPVKVLAEHPVDAAHPPADFDDGPMPPRHLDPRIIGNAEGNTRQRDRDRAAARRLLLEECDRADAVAGKRGGFVTTARIRELLRGRS